MFGGAYVAKTNSDKVIRVRYYTADMEDPTDRSFIEDIMSRSYMCQNALDKIGDIWVFREDTTFTKEGRYVVAIKYGEVMSPSAHIPN